MKQRKVRKFIFILILLCITVTLSTIAIYHKNLEQLTINQNQIIEKLEKSNYELISSNKKASVYSKKQNQEETINIKISKKNITFEYIRNTQEYNVLTSIIEINKNKKTSPKVLRVTGTKNNSPFNFQYYIKEDRLEYNPNDYIPADAWQISQNILTYFNEIENFLL